MGGVGSLAHIKAGVQAGASAIAAGSFFVFNGPHKAVLITYPPYNDLLQLLQK
jgi:cyclase